MEDAPQALGAHLGAQQSTETGASLRCTQHPWGDTEPLGMGSRVQSRGPNFLLQPMPASSFNSQQLHSHSARQIDFTSPQLNADNYSCLHQGTTLPGLRRRNHIPALLML